MNDGAQGGSTGGTPEGQSEEAAPLHLIRQRETELSRRVLGAKREADEIIADARRQVAAIIENANEESAAAAREQSRALIQKAEADAQALVADAQREAAELSASIEPRLGTAVDFLTNALTAK